MRNKNKILEEAGNLTKKERIFLELLLDIRGFQRNLRDKLAPQKKRKRK